VLQKVVLFAWVVEEQVSEVRLMEVQVAKVRVVEVVVWMRVEAEKAA